MNKYERFIFIILTWKYLNGNY